MGRVVRLRSPRGLRVTSRRVHVKQQGSTDEARTGSGRSRDSGFGDHNMRGSSATEKAVLPPIKSPNPPSGRTVVLDLIRVTELINLYFCI